MYRSPSPLQVSSPFHRFARSLLCGAVCVLPLLPVASVSHAEETGRKAVNSADDPRRPFKIKAAIPLPDGAILVCGKGGLGVFKDGVVTPQPDFPKIEAKTLAVDTKGRWWAGTEKAVYVREKEGTPWEKVLDADVRVIVADHDGSVIATIGEYGGVKRSRDGGKTWEPILALLPESMRAPASSLSEAK